MPAEPANSIRIRLNLPFTPPASARVQAYTRMP
jgi:hypothetical protein